MFKKKCPKCSSSVGKSYDFCPYCGSQLRRLKNTRKISAGPEDDWGMLGKDDLISQPEDANPFTSGFFGKGILNKMLGSAVKMIEKEMQKEMKNLRDMKSSDFAMRPKTNLQVYINGKKINLGENDNLVFGKNHKLVKKKKYPKARKSKKQIQHKSAKLPQKELKGFSKLSKQEPDTNIRRLSDRIIYEIKMPGVKSKKDISITKLENSIEIKALASTKPKKAYHKIIKVSLPIINYSLDKETLILELAAK